MSRNVLASLVAALALVVGLASVPAHAVATLSIEPASQTVTPGQDFSVDVAISDVVDLYAFQFDLRFDPAVVSASSTSEGPFLPDGGNTTIFSPGVIDNTAGLVSFVLDTIVGFLPGVSGSGVLATVDFKGLNFGASNLSLENVVLLDSSLADISSTLVGAVARVPEPGMKYLALVALVAMAIGIVARRSSVRGAAPL